MRAWWHWWLTSRGVDSEVSAPHQRFYDSESVQNRYMRLQFSLGSDWTGRIRRCWGHPVPVWASVSGPAAGPAARAGRRRTGNRDGSNGWVSVGRECSTEAASPAVRVGQLDLNALAAASGRRPQQLWPGDRDRQAGKPEG